MKILENAKPNFVWTTTWSIGFNKNLHTCSQISILIFLL